VLIAQAYQTSTKRRHFSRQVAQRFLMKLSTVNSMSSRPVLWTPDMSMLELLCNPSCFDFYGYYERWHDVITFINFRVFHATFRLPYSIYRHTIILNISWIKLPIVFFWFQKKLLETCRAFRVISLHRAGLKGERQGPSPRGLKTESPGFIKTFPLLKPFTLYF
jgi:hypothetical protein